MSKAMHRRVVNDLLMQATIATNPHSKKPKELIDNLRALLPPEDWIDESPKDSAGLARLKDMLKRG